MEKIFTAYKKVLLAHIASKTTCPLFHEKSEDRYNLLFEVFHTLSEKRQDLGLDKSGTDSLYNETYTTIEEVKKEVEAMIKGKNSVGMDNLLRGLVDKLECACGNARAFIEEEEEKKSPLL